MRCSGRCLEASEAETGLEFQGAGLMFSEAGADETEKLSAGRFCAVNLWPKAIFCVVLLNGELLEVSTNFHLANTVCETRC
jgi:hypothetical protein